eukprot:5344746-Alexandrium_andersonii.AAC.1
MGTKRTPAGGVHHPVSFATARAPKGKPIWRKYVGAPRRFSSAPAPESAFWGGGVQLRPIPSRAEGPAT